MSAISFQSLRMYFRLSSPLIFDLASQHSIFQSAPRCGGCAGSSVLHAQLDGGRAEETAPQRLGQHLRHDRLELRHFLRVAGCCAVRCHRALPYDIAAHFSRFVFGPPAEFVSHACIVPTSAASGCRRPNQTRRGSSRRAPATTPAPLALHQVQQRSGIFQADGQHASQPCRHAALETESRPRIVAVLVAAPAGDDFDAMDAQCRAVGHLPMENVQAKAAGAAGHGAEYESRR